MFNLAETLLNPLNFLVGNGAIEKSSLNLLWNKVSLLEGVPGKTHEGRYRYISWTEVRWQIFIKSQSFYLLPLHWNKRPIQKGCKIIFRNELKSASSHPQFSGLS